MKTFKFFRGYVDDGFPIIQRFLENGALISNDLVPVAPMPGPTGRLFYINNIVSIYNND